MRRGYLDILDNLDFLESLDFLDVQRGGGFGLDED